MTKMGREIKDEAVVFKSNKIENRGHELAKFQRT